MWWVVNFSEAALQTLAAVSQMLDKCQFPNAFDGAGGCHIIMKCLHAGNEARQEYHNFTNVCFLVLMGIVEADYKFLWTFLGLPGSSNDSFPFQASLLYQNIGDNDFLPEVQKYVNLSNGNGLHLPPIF